MVGTAADQWVTSPQRTIMDLLNARLRTEPDSPFLNVCGTRYTAAQLEVESNRIANGLASMGVRHGDRVATLLENSPAAVISFYAVVKLGAIYAPINTAHRGVFLEHQLSDADPAAFLVQGDMANRVQKEWLEGRKMRLVMVGDPVDVAGNIAWTPWSELERGSPRSPGVTVRPGDLAALIYTGGTTGPSKGCALSHNYMVHMTEGIGTSWGRTASDIVWTPLPLFHFNALGICLVATLAIGGSAVIVSKFSVSRFWQHINESGATIGSLLGSLAVMIARDIDRPEQPRSGTSTANTTLRMISGAPMPPEIDSLFRERFGVRTWSYAYGTTEASLLSRLPAGAEARVGSAGMPNDDDFDVRIFDDDDNEVPRGENGEIVCRPRKPNVMFSGYWGLPDATVEASRNWWFHTGDIGRIDVDGYLYFVDRKADYIRRRGENISSWELEKTFHEHEQISDVAISGVPSDVSEDEVKLTVVLRPGSTLTEEELCRWSFSRLPYFAVPRYIEIRQELPKNDTGRIAKARLRDEGLTPATWDREAAGLTVPR